MQKIEIDDIIEIVIEAGEIAKNFYNENYLIEKKLDKSPVTEADKKIDEFICKKLSRFNYPILSEETEDDFQKREKSEYVWIIDPLDGTKDFIQKTDEFSIIIGLVKNGVPVLGVVFAPMLDELYFAEKNKGAFLVKNGKKKKISVSKNQLRGGKIFVSRNHLGEWEQKIAKKYEMQIVTMGSAGLKICKVASGEAEIYINSGNKSSEWDVCAGDIILQEAGGSITDMNNEKIAYNKKDVKLRKGYIVLNKKIVT